MTWRDLPADARLLFLTMPGFGVETLRRLHAEPGWQVSGVVVGLIGHRPAWWRSCVAGIRSKWRGPAHRHAWRSEGPLAAIDAQRWLSAHGYRFHWLAMDEDVRRLRAGTSPRLTLTVTSRIIFSEATLASAKGDWLNVHPGLLPEYAGASPVPYMFADGRAGCTIHHMTRGVDTGAVVDVASLEDLGEDGGTLLYEHLPALAARRIRDVLQRWEAGALVAREQDPSALRHRSHAQLRRDRRLRWTTQPAAVSRWVRALMPFAPAYFVDLRGRRCEVWAAEVSDPCAAPAGRVLERTGRRVRVACGSGSVWLLCGSRCYAQAGDVLSDEDFNGC